MAGPAKANDRPRASENLEDDPTKYTAARKTSGAKPPLVPGPSDKESNAAFVAASLPSADRCTALSQASPRIKHRQSAVTAATTSPARESWCWDDQAVELFR